MGIRQTDRKVPNQSRFLLTVEVCCIWTILVCGGAGKALGWDNFPPDASIMVAITPAGSDIPIPGIFDGGEGFDVEKMWKVFFKSPTATQAEMKAREKNGGFSPFAGKTHLSFSCFYPISRKILIPAEFSETRATLAYAYELKHFEQGRMMLDLQAQLREGTISVSRFVDRCLEFEAQAAYQEVKVARELRKAWVFGADSDWEAYCWSGEEEVQSVSNILAAMDGHGIVRGTGRTARGYYMWLAAQKLQDASPERRAGKENMASVR